MSRLITISNVSYWLGMALWFGALMTGAIAAIFVFGTLPELGVSLERYSAYSPAEADAHSTLAAGHIMERIFTTAAFARIAAGVLVIIGAALTARMFMTTGRLWSNLGRVCAIIAAAGLTGYASFGPAREFNAELRGYWSSAEAGDDVGAAAHKTELDRLHPRLSTLMQFEFALIAIAIITSAIAMTPRITPDKASPLADPDLLKKGRP